MRNKRFGVTESNSPCVSPAAGLAAPTRCRGAPAAAAGCCSRGCRRPGRPARDHALERPRSHAAPAHASPRCRRGCRAPLRRRVRVACGQDEILGKFSLSLYMWRESISNCSKLRDYKSSLVTPIWHTER